MADHEPARVALLSDGLCLSDGGGQYGLVPRPRWTQLQTPDDQNRLAQVLRCALIRSGGRNILVDCGCGDKALLDQYYTVVRPQGSLLDDLARHGVAPSDIDTVILTHLHGDHCGWMTRPTPGGRYRGINTAYGPADFEPVFPKARYLVQRVEYEAAMRPNERTRNTYFPENYQPLLASGALTLLDGDTEIAPGIRVVSTPGHSEGHQSVIVDDAVLEAPAARGTLFYLGELATVMIQFLRLPWVTAYDVLPMTTIDTKRRWQAWSIETGAIVVTGHDGQTVAARIGRDARGFATATEIR